MNREGREAAQAVAVAVEPQELTQNTPSCYSDNNDGNPSGCPQE